MLLTGPGTRCTLALMFLGLMAMTWLLSAATLPAVPMPRLETDKLSIVGGVVSQEGAWPSVVALKFPNGVLCSGTIVAENLVVTAAHCFYDAQKGELLNHPHNGILIHLGNRVSSSQVMRSSLWFTHPRFCRAPGCKDDSFDYAVITIGGSFNLERYPRPLVQPEEYDRVMRAGQVITLVGFGADDQGEMGTKRHVNTEIRTFTPLGRQFLTKGEGRDSCRGDSGGPAFVTSRDGSLIWAGVLSAGLSNCGEGGYYGVPRAVLPWLQEIIRNNPGGCLGESCLEPVPAPPLSPPGVGSSCAMHPKSGHFTWSALLSAGLLGLACARRRGVKS